MEEGKYEMVLVENSSEWWWKIPLNEGGKFL